MKICQKILKLLYEGKSQFTIILSPGNLTYMNAAYVGIRVDQKSLHTSLEFFFGGGDENFLGVILRQKLI